MKVVAFSAGSVSLKRYTVDAGSNSAGVSINCHPARRGCSITNALIDGLVHHCHVVNICGKSYRMRDHTELTRALGRTRPSGARAAQRASTKEEETTA